jgi:hypothetical protein
LKRATDGAVAAIFFGWKQLYGGLVHLNRTVRQLKEENGRLKKLIADWSFGMLRDMPSKESQRMQRV